MVAVVFVVFSVATELGLFFPPQITLFVSTENHLPSIISFSLLQNPFVIFHIQLEYLRLIGKCFILLAGYFTSMLNS